MAHTITIHLSALAQRAALLTGQPAASEQSYDVTQDQIAALLALPWTVVHSDGTASCSVPHRVGYSEWLLDHPELEIEWRGSSSHYGSACTLCDNRPADAAAAISWAAAQAKIVAETIEAKRAERVADKAERSANALAAIQSWAALPLAERRLASNKPTEHFHRCADVAPEACAEIAAAEAAERAEKERLAALRPARIRHLVLEHGSVSARERIAADPSTPLGCLAGTEAIEILRDHFLPIDAARGLSAYVGLDESDVAAHCDEDCSSCDPSYESLPLADAILTGEEWTALKVARAAVEAAELGGKIEPRLHRGQCDRHCCPSWPVSRIGVRVTLDLGDGVTVQREYGA